VTLWAAVLLIRLTEVVAREMFVRARRPFPLPDLIVSMVRLVVYGTVLFAILRFQLGFNVTPLLASTALVTAVVGFALQGVLGNLLSGMSLHIVGSVIPGDWIAVGDVEGEIIETNWRETRLRTVGGHVVVVPNSTVASSVVHNMTRPSPLRRHTISVGASYSDAPAEVIEALLGAARSVPEVRREPAPSAYVTDFKDYGINYELRCWTERYHDRTPVDGAVRRMIWYQFKRRGIEIPFPMSDKLLNDFMEVVYHQRRKPPDDEEIERRATELRASDLFGRMLRDEGGRPILGEEEIRRVARLLRRLSYTDGETIFRQGEAGETCGVLVRGRVRGRIEYDGGHGSEFGLQEGAIFGEMSLMAGLPRTATLTADGEVEVLEMTRAGFAALLSLRAEIPDQLSRIVADRAAENAEALNRLKELRSAESRHALRRETLLNRFMRIIGLGSGGGADERPGPV
jgi:small-conductance mechanosensitive channel/CRP-like cAMP-binding protein